jgi:hypothetical protein
MLKVYVNKLTAGAMIQLYSMNGSLVRSSVFTSNARSVSVKGLTAGLYYIVVGMVSKSLPER